MPEGAAAEQAAMHAAAGQGQGGWIADPFACSRCGRSQEPMRQTCSGPTIARLCPSCRAAVREHPPAARVLVCEGGCCTRFGARAVANATRQALAGRGLAEHVEVVPVRCIGRCALGPYVRVATTAGAEPAGAAAFRAAAAERARVHAAQSGYAVDGAVEANLSRFAARVGPSEAEELVDGLAEALSLPGPPPAPGPLGAPVGPSVAR